MNTIIKKILNSKILSSTILVWILSSIDILLVISVLIIDSRFPKYLFGADNPKANGDFLTICFSVIGGGAVIYGLYLNNKRIKEQTRQNDIAMKQADTAQKQADIAANNNNDKRFGDAVGYLGSDNTSIVLGGIHILHQLAKEDKRYIPIVTNMYTSYLKDKSDVFFADDRYCDKAPVFIQAIIDILFAENSVFKYNYIDLSEITLKNIHFNSPVKNVNFLKSDLEKCGFDFGMEYCDFTGSTITDCSFGNGLHRCEFAYTKIRECLFLNNKCDSFIFKDCKFTPLTVEESCFLGYRIIGTEFELYRAEEVAFIVKEIVDSKFSCFDTESISFQGTQFINSEINNNNNITFERAQPNPFSEF